MAKRATASSSKPKKRRRPAKKSARTTSRKTAEKAPAEGLREAHKRFVDDVQEAHRSFYESHAQMAQAAGAEMQARLERVDLAGAYRNCVQEMQKAAGQPDAHRLQAAAYRNYLQTLQGAQNAVTESYKGATRSYLAALQQLVADAQAKLQEAHSTYADSVRKAWSQYDPKESDPAALLSIGLSAMAAAAASAPQTPEAPTER